MTEDEVIRAVRLARRVCTCFGGGYVDGRRRAADQVRTAWPELAAVYEDELGFCRRAGVSNDRVAAVMYRAVAGKERDPAPPNLSGLTYDFSKLVSAVLHMGFLSLEETEEMLARLDPPDPAEDDAPVARSRIVKSNNPIRPIDRVAVRVAPPPTGQEE